MAFLPFSCLQQGFLIMAGWSGVEEMKSSERRIFCHWNAHILELAAWCNIVDNL
jgi:hypothetical protein